MLHFVPWLHINDPQIVIFFLVLITNVETLNQKKCLKKVVGEPFFIGM